MSTINTTIRPASLQSEIPGATHRDSARADLNWRAAEAELAELRPADWPSDPPDRPTPRTPRTPRTGKTAKPHFDRLDRLGKIKSRLMAADPRCYFCGRPLRKRKAATLDHLNPRSKGGTDDPENLVLSCLPCNQSKADRTPEEWAGAILNAIAGRLADPAIPPAEITATEITTAENPAVAVPQGEFLTVPPLAKPAEPDNRSVRPLDLHRLEWAGEWEAVERMTAEERRQYADKWAVEESRRSPFTLKDSEDRGDAISVAWEMARECPLPWRLALRYAWKHVRNKGRRLYPEAGHSITTHRKVKSVSRGRGRARPTSSSRLRLLRDACHPAATVPLKIDVQAWLTTIPPTRRTIAVMLAQGCTHREIAIAIDVTPAYVGNFLIPNMAASWGHFTSLTDERTDRNANPLRTLTERFLRQEAGIPPRQRQALRLLLIGAHSIESAAKLMECSGTCVSASAHKALDKIGARSEERHALMAKPHVRRRLLRQLAAGTPADASAIAAELDIGRADA